MHPSGLYLALSALFLANSAYCQELGDPPPAPRPATLRTGKTAKFTGDRNAVFPAWVDTSNRTTVRNFYLSSYLPTIGVATGWVGDVQAGVWGTTSVAYKEAVSTRINWVRSMAGVPPMITLDPVLNDKDQQAAMMMSANNQINHTPPASWINYTAEGAAAAGQSNLCIGYTLLYDPGCVLGYIQDNGGSNSSVGHRRWILYPQTQVMGTGDVSPSGVTLRSANASWVIDSHYSDPRPATRNVFVAWPPPGFVPFDVVFPRWSISYPNADFSSATVTMTKAGAAIPVRLEIAAAGFGENTLVWVPENADVTSSFLPIRPAGDVVYTVQISNVKGTGVPPSFSYTVTSFDPAPPAVNITVNSNPANLGLFVDSTFVTSNTFQWIPGDLHNLSWAIYQPTGGTRFGFGSWSDGGEPAHAIVVTSAATLTVNYITQYLLTTTVSPASSGSILASPTSTDGYYNSGTSVQLTATAGSGNNFTSFSGNLLGSANPQSVVMTAPRSVTANFNASGSLGTISATTNLATASFSITGAAAYAGSGTSFLQANAPAGSYTITYGAVGCYATPISETRTLTAGGTLNFTIANYQPQTYSLNPTSANVTATAGAGSIALVNAQGCTLSPSTTANWIVPTLSTSNINYSYTLNSGASRTGTIVVGNQTFTLNQAAQTVAVPNVVGQTQAGATTAITSAGLVLGVVTTASSSTVVAGSIITQNPAATTQVAMGTSVALVVSTGPPTNGPPTLDGTPPVAGSGSGNTFVFKFSHTSGYQQLGVLNMLMNQYLDGNRACYIAYSQPSQVLYLVNDLGPGSGLSAGLTLGATGSVSNGQCTVLSAGSSAVGVGTTLTLTLNIQFKTGFTGSQVIYLAGRDVNEVNSGWQTKGVWTTPGGITNFPNPVAVTPATGSTASTVISYVYDDQTNANNLQTVWALINTAIDGRQACYVAYYVPGNQLYLYPDNGDGSQATNIALTGTNIIENSRCRIGAAGSSVTKAGNRLTLNLNVQFTGLFTGPRGIWTAAQTLGLLTSPWKALGAWQVP